MTAARRARPRSLAVAAALALPAAACAHAALVRTSPSASGTVNVPPRRGRLLTFSEAVEPRFAVVSVTDAAGNQQTAGAAEPVGRRTRRRSSSR